MKKFLLIGLVTLLVLGASTYSANAFVDVSDGIALFQSADVVYDIPVVPSTPVFGMAPLYALHVTGTSSSKKVAKKRNGLTFSQLARARLRSVK